jgi:hypothetical protein
MKARPYKCTCDFCTKWHPFFKRVGKKLSGRDLKLFEELFEKEMNEEEELAVAESKLAGKWPGWEWMKEAIEKHRKQ